MRKQSEKLKKQNQQITAMWAKLGVNVPKKQPIKDDEANKSTQPNQNTTEDSQQQSNALLQPVQLKKQASVVAQASEQSTQTARTTGTPPANVPVISLDEEPSNRSNFFGHQ